ncbi:hypothetical protein ACN47E_005913 [Coniothyrium glycines]
MTTRFEIRKKTILAQLDTPEDAYQDLSPKGSIDEPIRGLINEINALDGLVTTSSCSGRLSVFLEGRKTEHAEEDSATAEELTRAGSGGKGGGGTWLYISHAPFEATATFPHDLTSTFGLEGVYNTSSITPDVSCRYIHFKFEPMILHVLTSSLVSAQRMLTAALTAGFRESGAVGLGSIKTNESNPVVAVRSAGYSFDSIIGFQDQEGHNVPLVDETYLQTLVKIANDRFRINVDRIARFRSALLEAYCTQGSTDGALRPHWEDAEVRRQRKREEGLARQRALRVTEARVDDKISTMADRDSVESVFS